MSPRRMGTPPPAPLVLTRRGWTVVGVAFTVALVGGTALLEGLSVLLTS